ncbi:MAG: hypothetical protein CYG61_09975 [Actinobacteria bacterium]|nr:MAG: hypothetical protein CYG61_09975 [Actinomycetota bacterium]
MGCLIIVKHRLPMGQTAGMEGADASAITAELACDPKSASLARRLVANALTDAGHGAMVEQASLLVSEAVTNAILHAGTPILLTCSWTGSSVRVEVHDGSPVLPGVRHYNAEATTGRGLSLVAALASRWGVEAGDHGKTLWFELGTSAADAEVDDVEAERRRSMVTVELLDASPALLLATIEYGEAVLREMALLSLGGELDAVLPGGWRLPNFDVGPILAVATAARDAGRERVDLEVALPPEAGDTSLERLRLVDVADGLARQGRLLIQPAVPEIGACRHWLYSQIHEQWSGTAAQPWRLPDLLQPARVAAVLPAEEVASLRTTAVATIVADDANRIIFVNDLAGDLLGWESDALVGQRLTVIVPPALRERHLAGFSRLQLTGESQLLDRPFAVPALRRDGSEVAVVLTISAVKGHAGRQAFRASLRRRSH